MMLMALSMEHLHFPGQENWNKVKYDFLDMCHYWHKCHLMPDGTANGTIHFLGQVHYVMLKPMLPHDQKRHVAYHSFFIT